MQVLPKLLVIEDNRSLQSALLESLQTEYQIDTSLTGKAGIYKTDTENYDVILLDLNLPDVSGLAVCQELRERGVSTPILILSAEVKVLSKINLLDAGANDYLTKPFSLGELKARLRALQRTTKSQPKVRNQLSFGDLTLNPVNFEVTRSGMSIMLRRKEFLMLECLMINAGQTVTREALANYAWSGSDKPWANTLEVHVKYLRDKIDRPFDTAIIATVHGIGYRLTEQPSFAAINEE